MSTSTTRRANRQLASTQLKRAVAAALAIASSGMFASRAGAVVSATWNDPSSSATLTYTTAGDTFWTSSVTLKDGDSIKPTASVAGSVQVNTNYYVVGVGSTAGATVRFANVPGGVSLFAVPAAPTSVTVQLATNWQNPASWAGGVPNGVDDSANIAANANTTAIELTKDTTLGSLSFSGAANDAVLLSTVVGNAGPLSVLNFATSSGTPTVTTSGGKSLSFGDSLVASTNNGGRMVIAGNQGLTIDNQNAIAILPPSTANASAGAVKFGIFTDWSHFSGTLTLARGAFANVGATLANGVSALPMNNTVVLGTGGNAAQLEMPGNNGVLALRGLNGNSASAVINNSTGGGPALTLGTYSTASDVFNFQGSIGAPVSALNTGSVPANLRLTKIGAGTQILSGASNPFSNNTELLVLGGKLSLGTTGTIGTLSGVGQATATSASATNQILQLHNGEFEMDGTAANKRIQNFSGALIATNGTGAGNVYDRFSSGINTITLPADPAQSVSMNFASLQPRNIAPATASANANGLTYLFRGTSLGSAPGNGVATITFTTNPLSAGQQATLGTTSAAVLKGALADTSATGSGAGFATYDATNGIRMLTAAEQDATGYAGAGPTINTRLNLPAGNTPITGVTSQTLQLDNTSGSPATVTNSGTALNASSGILISGTSAVTLTGGTLTGTAATDNEDVVIQSTNTAGASIDIAITNLARTTPTVTPGWITYGGTGNFGANPQFTITGAQTLDSAFSSSRGNGIAFNGTGTTLLKAAVNNANIIAVNQGTVQLGAGASFSAKGQLQVAAGATFDFNDQSGATIVFDSVSVPAFNGNLTAPNTGGLITNTGSTIVDLNLGGAGATGTAAPLWSGVIAGNLNLILGKTAGNLTEVLVNSNTYNGTTTVKNANILSIGRYGNLPVGKTVTLGDGSTTGFLVLGDTNLNGSGGNGAVNQEITNLVTGAATGSAVQGGANNASILTINNPSGTDTYNGVLGNLTATNASPGNTNNLTLRKRGAGTLVLGGTAPNYYTGGTFIEGGTLSVAADNKLGGLASITGSTSGPVSPLSVIANNININGGTLQATGTFTLGSSMTAAGSLPAAQQAPADRRGIGIGPTSGGAGGTGVIEVTGANTLTDNAPVANGGNTGTNHLIKAGSGTLILGGANSYNGNTTVLGGLLNVTGSIVNNGSPNVFIATDGDGTFGTANDTTLMRVALGSYAGLGSTELGGLNSAANLVQGANVSGTDQKVTMRWRQRATAETDGSSPPLPSGVTQLASDVMGLNDMANSGGASGQTDAFTLELAYNAGLAGDDIAAAAGGGLYLAWLDSSGTPQWKNAVAGDTGTGGSAVAGYVGSWASFAAANSITDANLANFLGSWGADPAGDQVWAVLNHNSEFSAVSSAVPEPACVGVLAIAATGLLARRRRR